MTRKSLPFTLLAGGLVALCLACRPGSGAPLSAVEATYEEARSLRDQIDVTRARGAQSTRRGTSLADLVGRYRAAREKLQSALQDGPRAGLGADDRRALDVIKRSFGKDLVDEKDPAAAGAAPASADGPGGADCAYDPVVLSQGPDGMKTLSERMYACFGQAARHLSFEGRTLDRLTVFGLLPVTDEPSRRKRLFLSMEPIWKAVNGDDGPASPYRRLVRLSAAKMIADKTSVEAGTKDVGVDPGVVEDWLTSVLESWREIAPDQTVEPWDFAYQTGVASRRLRPVITREILRPVNERYYKDLGADVAALNVQYDLEPREGKNPVAFTTFGARPRLQDGVWTPGEPWVFASYSIGSIDNLNELLHESGHAIHIAAIRARPAFEDWPDSDLFTEAIADIAALEMFEPAWQGRYLGASVPLADSLRAKYAGIVMDTAWALFEIRMHHNPEADPNLVWTDITQRYFRIRPHPELSWWAVRGQLIDLPGYMLNYAVGAILVADLRARLKELHGLYAEGDPGWYAWVSERLYRFGLERSSRRVIEDFLGRPVTSRALLDDLARARTSSPRLPTSNFM